VLELKMQDLNLILGRSGSGKSVFLTNEVKKLAENQRNNKLSELNKKIIIIVPDQYTVSVERLYITLLGEAYMPFLRILSFKRLASLVFNITGGLAYEFIGQGGKLALLSKALELSSVDLKY
jgi:ATP-dependent helicase/nuclease subunit B